MTLANPDIAEDLTQPVRGWAERTPDACAISTSDATLTYAALDGRITRCAGYLGSNGVTAHDVCALEIEDRLLFVICWFALFRLRVTSLALAPDTPAPRRAAIIAEGGVGIVLSDGAERTGGPPVVAIDMARVEAFDADPAHPPKPGHSDHAMRVVGSGTTGKPKLIAIGFAAILKSALQEARALGFDQTDHVMSSVRPWVSSIMMAAVDALSCGACFHLRTDARRNLFDDIARTGVTHVLAAVIHVEQMLSLAERLGRGLPEGVTLTIYGSLVTDGLSERALRHLTPSVRILYAANEVGPIAGFNLCGRARPPGSVGRVLACSDLQIVDRRGDRLPPGTPGLVRARGPRMFDGYVGEPEETARALKDGWFYPGDAARIDADGHVIMLGRSDQVMVYDGINIHPAEIEDAVSRHPAVRDVAVIPLPHKIHQDVPVCAVVLTPDALVTEADLRRFAHGLLAERMPALVIVLPRIPRTESGKVIRTELRAALLARMRSARH